MSASARPPARVVLHRGHVGSRARRAARLTGLLLMILGVGVVAWGVVVWRWQDPFTALYTMYEQRQLAHAYEQRLQKFRPVAVPPAAQAPHPSTTVAANPSTTVAAKPAAPAAPKPANPAAPRGPSVASEQRVIDRQARLYRLSSHEGDPLGRIVVKRLGLNMVVVDGTDESTLERGPGRDLETFMPGEGRLVYIAGHRTTYLAPFSHIDALRPGDTIKLELPYATFVYSVTRHIIVRSDDLSVLRSGTHEVLALQACHPRFFATHRYIVYARPVRVIPAAAIGPAYTPPGSAGRG